MTHEEAFLQDILENRDDDTPRRIFADWLMDCDDPASQSRGEFIHLQCDLARHPAGVARPQASLRRERDLLWTHGKHWGGGLERFGCVCWEYRRGFVEGVGMSAAAFVSHARTLLSMAPVRDLKVYDAAGKLAALGQCESLASLRCLDLEKNDLGDLDVADLARSPHLGGLASLLLWNNRVSDGGLVALAAADLPALTRLDLSNNLIGDLGAIALAGSPMLGRLRVLDLTGNQIGDPGAVALAGSPGAVTLGWLDLTKNPIGTSQGLLRERLAGRVQVLG
jgi:uncharacterized protein (TIGR02996 family)